MNTIGKPKIINIPRLLGFKEHNRPGAIVWDLPIANKNPSPVQKSRIQNPWTYDELQILERKDNLRLHKADISLNVQQLSANLSKLCRKYFGHKTKIDLQYGGNQNIWCLFEFTQNGSPNKPRKKSQSQQCEKLLHYPLGIGGFQFRLLIDSDQIKIVISNHFGLGFVPTDFCTKIHKFIIESLNLERFINFDKNLLSSQSIFEIDISICSILFDLLKAQQKTADDDVIYDLIKSLAANSSLPNSQISGNGNVWKFQVPSPIENSMSLIQGFDNLTEDVLESRELVNKYSQIEKLLLNGKINDAKTVILKNLEIKPQERFLLRRLSLLEICGVKTEDTNLIVDALKSEPHYLLFLSAAVFKNIKNSNHHETLKYLSQLGVNLMKLVPNANYAKPFDVVLPELLGDAWSFSNETKAEECYLRVIQKRGEQPRILKKIIQLAKDGGQAEIEYNLLERLSKAERRHIELSKIHLRLAELQQSHSLGLSDAISQALKAVSFDRNNVEAALLAARLLNETEKSQEAIGLLDSLLQSPKCSISDKYRSNIHLLIGDLWNNSLNREELAESRYKDSLELNPGNARAIKKLELIYRQRKDFEALAQILEKKFSLLEKESDSNSLKVVFEELITIYRGNLNTPELAYSLCLKLIESSRIEPEEIDRMLGWREISIDWVGLYNKLIQRIDDTKNSIKLAKFHNRLADICKEKLKDNAKALEHLLEAHHLGYLEKSGFDYLVEKTNEAGKQGQLLELYESRLRATEEDVEREELISRLLQLSENLSDKRRDELSLELYNMNSEAETTLQLRYSYYQAMGDIESIENLWSQTLQLNISTSLRSKWSFAAIEYIKATEADHKFDTIKRIFEYRIENESEIDSIVDEAISCLKESGSPDHLLRFIALSLQKNKIPNISEKLVQRTLLGNQKELADYYYLKFKSAEDSTTKAANARLAIAIWEHNEADNKKAHELLYELSKLILLSENELQILMAHSEEHNSWHNFAKALVTQLSFSQSKNRDNNINNLLESVYFDKLKNWEEAYHLNLRFLEQNPNNLELIWKLAKCAEHLEDKSGAKKWFGKFINSHDSLKFEDKLREGVRKLLSLGKSKSGLIKIFETKIDLALESSDFNQAARYALAVIDEGIESTKIYDAVFLRDMQYDQDDSAVNFWWKALKLVTTSSQARQYLKSTKSLCEKKNSKLLVACLDKAFEENVGKLLGKKIHKEILIFHANQIFENNIDRDRSFKLYSQAFKLDPEDQRCWIPLYFLFGEFGKGSEKLLHLRHIISRIKKDPRPLKKYPITIESLEAELSKLEESIGLDNHNKASNIEVEDQQSENKYGLGVVLESDNMPQSESDESVSIPAINPDLISIESGISPDEPLNEQLEGLSNGNIDNFNLNDSLESVKSIDLNFDNSEDSNPEALGNPRTSKLPPPPILKPADPENESETNEVSIKWSDAPIIPPPPVSSQMNETHRFTDRPNVLFDQNSNFNGSPAAFLDLGSEEIPEHDNPTADQNFDVAASSQVNFQDNSLAFNLESLEEAPVPVFREAISPETSDENSFTINLNDLGISSDKDPTQGTAIEHTDLSNPSLGIATDEDQSNSHDEIEAPFALNDINDTNVNFSISQISNLSLNNSSIQSSKAPEVFEGTSSVNNNTEIDEIDQNSEQTTILPSNDDTSSENSLEIDQTSILPSVENSIHENEFSSAGDSEFSESSNEGSGLKVEENNNLETINWRELISDSSISPETTQKLMTQAFASEIEKHVAIQTAGLLAGNCHILQNWHWRVWRNPDEYGYPITGKNRYPSGQSADVLHSSLTKFMITLAPVFVKLNSKKFTLEETATRLRMKVDALEKNKEALNWESGYLGDIGFKQFSTRIKDRKYQAFNLPGLNAGIIYLGASRSFYIDVEYFKKKPPSHAFHKILKLMWSIKLRYFIPLSLSIENDIMPILQDINQIYGGTGISKIKSYIIKGSTHKVLAKLDSRKIETLHSKVGLPTINTIEALFHAMDDHLNRLVLCETLDVIGLFESISKKDFLKPDKYKPGEIFDINSDFGNLLRFMTKLNL